MGNGVDLALFQRTSLLGSRVSLHGMRRPTPSSLLFKIVRQKLFLTYVFKAILAKLSHQVEKAERREPRHPKDNLVEILNVDDAKNKDELVENEVPEFVFHVL